MFMVLARQVLTCRSIPLLPEHVAATTVAHGVQPDRTQDGKLANSSSEIGKCPRHHELDRHRAPGGWLGNMQRRLAKRRLLRDDGHLSVVDPSC